MVVSIPLPGGTSRHPFTASSPYSAKSMISTRSPNQTASCRARSVPETDPRRCRNGREPHLTHRAPPRLPRNSSKESRSVNSHIAAVKIVQNEPSQARLGATRRPPPTCPPAPTSNPHRNRAPASCDRSIWVCEYDTPPPWGLRPEREGTQGDPWERPPPFRRIGKTPESRLVQRVDRLRARQR